MVKRKKYGICNEILAYTYIIREIKKQKNKKEKRKKRLTQKVIYAIIYQVVITAPWSSG